MPIGGLRDPGVTSDCLYPFNSGNRRFRRSRQRCGPMLASKYED